ncbi:hypothetical protein CROQUDRAFT_43788, partial [Cronartium quercuum f. sp. fusiforme G11]
VALRTEKLSGAKRDRKKVESSRVNRLVWFCYALDPSLSSCSLEELHQLVQDFIQRHSVDLENERKLRRPGRPKSSNQERMEIDQEIEEAEYKTGFVLPDLTCFQSVKLLRQWCENLNGDPSFLPRLRLIRIFKNEPLTVIEEQKGAADNMFSSSTSTNLLDVITPPQEDDDEGDDTPELIMGE